MKMYKKLISVCMALLCAALLMTAGTAAVFAEEVTEEEGIVAESAAVTDETEYLKSSAEQFTQQIIGMADESIDQAVANFSDDPSVAVLESWKSSKAEVGALKEIGDISVEDKDDEYVITVPASFEKYNGEFEYVLDKNTGSFTSTTFNVNYPLSENMKRAALNTLMGLGTVFLVLAFLMWVIGLFKYIPNGSKKKEAPAPAPAPAPAAAAPVVEEETDDTELVAVIAAAIAAAEGTTPDGFVVRSIRRVGRAGR